MEHAKKKAIMNGLSLNKELSHENFLSKGKHGAGFKKASLKSLTQKRKKGMGAVSH